jgi:hypothetical protein
MVPAWRRPSDSRLRRKPQSNLQWIQSLRKKWTCKHHSMWINQPNDGVYRMSKMIAGIQVPDSAIARATTQLVRDTEDDLLYNHSRRVFFWGALTGERRGLKYDPELLYLGAMFHDMGLTERYSSPNLRFEVDGANTARDFMKDYGVSERDIEDVWTAIALHTTPGIPEHMRPTIALVTAGVEMDVLGIAYDEFPDDYRREVCESLFG